MTSTAHSIQRSSFAAACGLLEEALDGSARREIVEEAAASGDLGAALRRLRDSFQSHTFRHGSASISLASAIARHDSRTRADGFHVLNDWDGKADHVNDDIIPVDVLDYLIARRGADPVDRRRARHPARLLLLPPARLAVGLRMWDEGDPDANLDRLDALLGALQGPDGSGQRFVDDAETLILIATSHFEMHERGYALAAVAGA